MDPRERQRLEELYKKKNFQQLTLEEYAALRRERMKREQRRMPKPIQMALSFFTYIFFIICCFFMLYIVYLIIVNWQ